MNELRPRPESVLTLLMLLVAVVCGGCGESPQQKEWRQIDEMQADIEEIQDKVNQLHLNQLQMAELLNSRQDGPLDWTAEAPLLATKTRASE